MRATAWLLASFSLLGLAACYSAPANTPEGHCERAAGQDPAIQQAEEDAGSELAGVRGEALIRERALRHAFMGRCLSGLGAGPPGGVAPVTPDY